jgi:hypothetical protein
MAPNSEDRRGFHLEKSVSIGHILTTISLIVMAFAWTSSVDKHLAVHDTQITELQESDRRQMKDMEITKAEIITQLQSINDKLDRFVEREMRRRDH